VVKRKLSRRGRRKKIVRQHLHSRDLRVLVDLAAEDQGVLVALVAFLLEQDALLRWRAIEALGRVAADWAARDLDRVRDLVRRQFWSMNDESGGIAWHAPEAIGEILFNVPVLAAEFVSNLASFSDMYPFQPGVHWALSRLAESRPELLQDEVPRLIRSLASDDVVVRGHAARALALLGSTAALAAIRDDPARLLSYDMKRGELQETTVRELAACGPSR
jgi:HEAT repeat protein